MTPLVLLILKNLQCSDLYFYLSVKEGCKEDQIVVGVRMVFQKVVAGNADVIG